MKLREVWSGSPAERAAAAKVESLKEERHHKGGYIKPADARKLQAARKEMHPRTIRRGLAAFVATAATGLVAVSLLPGSTEHDHPKAANSAHEQADGFKLKIIDQNFFGTERTAAIRQAATDWDKVYGCSRPVTVRPYTQYEKLPAASGAQATTLEVTTPGDMQVGLQGETRNVVLHAMSHACHDREVPLEKPITYSDGKIIAYEGLALIVQLNSGEQTRFQGFEEGMAERNASAFDDYSVPNAGYHAAGQYTRELFPLACTAGENYMKYSDVQGFVDAIYQRPVGTPISAAEIESLMGVYDGLLHRATTPAQTPQPALC